ncbi:MAG: hypothetical protein KKD29_03125 [Candidatus Omnitrophica bacterium]|nr:hypothetical protein [Candidatus Omnitrophota bacterium]MBU4488750.1 hypothetical protein [Candidatus Omnitrophota bacterium]MCG2705847.1 hypothetical protein [Candidatus Omnitrophota bacterium]
METIFAIGKIIIGIGLIVSGLVPKYRPFIGMFAALLVALLLVERMVK